MKKHHPSTYKERYEIGFARGYRLGRIEATRDIVKRVLNFLGKPSKELIRYIMMESDLSFLDKILHDTIKEKISVEELNKSFLTVFRSEQEVRDELFTIY